MLDSFMGRKLIKYELDGRGVTPATVDSVDGLRALYSYLEALEYIANWKKYDLSFTGIAIKNKCLQATTSPSNAEYAKLCVKIFHDWRSNPDKLAPKSTGLLWLKWATFSLLWFGWIPTMEQ